MRDFLTIIGAIALFILGPVLYSYIQVQLWDWYVVPLGVMHIGKAAMYGLNLFVGTFHLARKPEKEWYYPLIGILVIWAFGAFVHAFLM